MTTYPTYYRNVSNWVREALLLPLAPQSTVIAMSSGRRAPRLTAERRLRRGQSRDPFPL
jgi:hypothetical protein